MCGVFRLYEIEKEEMNRGCTMVESERCLVVETGDIKAVLGV